MWIWDKNREIRKCVICGESFEAPKHKTNQCCSKKCAATLAFKNRTKKLEKFCLACGEKFLAKTPNQKYCSLNCSRKHARKSPDIIKTCPICGKSFLENKKHRDHLCCSKSCGLKLSWKKRKEKQSSTFNTVIPTTNNTST